MPQIENEFSIPNFQQLSLATNITLHFTMEVAKLEFHLDISLVKLENMDGLIGYWEEKIHL